MKYLPTFRLRDALWFVVLVAVSLAWMLDRISLLKEGIVWRERAEGLKDVLDDRYDQSVIWINNNEHTGPFGIFPK